MSVVLPPLTFIGRAWLPPFAFKPADVVKKDQVR